MRFQFKAKRKIAVSLVASLLMVNMSGMLIVKADLIGGADYTSTTPQGVTVSAFAGNGSSDPYKISSADDLAELATLVNSGATDSTTGYLYSTESYLQTQDINNLSTSYPNWTPIGTDNLHPFCGDFNGGNWTISNLTINSTSSNQGLFGYVGSSTPV
jgi:hypothetical protein